MKWVEGDVVRERKGRERKYTGGGRKLEEYGRKGEGGGDHIYPGRTGS